MLQKFGTIQYSTPFTLQQHTVIVRKFWNIRTSVYSIQETRGVTREEIFQKIIFGICAFPKISVKAFL